MSVEVIIFSNKGNVVGHVIDDRIVMNVFTV